MNESVSLVGLQGSGFTGQVLVTPLDVQVTLTSGVSALGAVGGVTSWISIVPQQTPQWFPIAA